MKIILSFILTSLYFTSSAQLWQLSGYALQTNPRVITIAVIDNNGKAVAGLKKANFIAYGESFNSQPNVNIDNYSTLEIVNNSDGNGSFQEIFGGLYSMKVQFTGANSSLDIQHIFLQVVTITAGIGSRPGQLKSVLTQHAQIIL